MENEKIRNQLKTFNLKQWQLADLLGISEFTLTRKLRHELPAEEQKRICELIEKAAAGKRVTEHD